jgi:sugar lactone lactonase YvrE
MTSALMFLSFNTRRNQVALFLLLIPAFFAPGLLSAQEQDEVRGAPAEPADTPEIRAQMAIAENLLGKTPDRGAVLYFLAVSYAQLHETRGAMSNLSECVALQEGFDPDGDPAFAALKPSGDFTRLVQKAHKDFPAVARSRLAYTIQEKDLIPEGLAYDSLGDLFYLSSLYRRKIVKIPYEGKPADFFPPDRDDLLPVLGIRLDPTDGSIWANSFLDTGRTELLHFDRAGKLLGRFSIGGQEKHGFNDLVVLRSGVIYLTDTLTHKFYRFDTKTQKFADQKASRPLLQPNGIALSDDEQTLYVADQLGIIHVDLTTHSSTEVDPGPHNTVSGADGLYWHKNTLIAIQNGIGSPRIAQFTLSKDGLRVTKTTILENRSTFTVLPTTGALRDEDFYFIVNSQLDNLNGTHILDPLKLEPIRIGVLHLP